MAGHLVAFVEESGQSLRSDIQNLKPTFLNVH